MTTLADITLRVAITVADVLRSASTAGAGTTLTDSVMLKQPAGFWEGGTLWLRSGTHSGKVVRVSASAPDALTFPDLGSTPHPCRYAVADRRFPFDELTKAVNAALADEGAKVLNSNATLTGDGQTLEFTLPAGVSNVRHVEFKDTSATPPQVTPSHHWRERGTKLIFDTGCPPINGDTILLWYRAAHVELTTYSDVIDPEINEDWLKWQAAMEALLWALTMYGDSPEKSYATKLQWALEQLKTLAPLRTLDISLRTA
jgi:hypothetical protein